MQHRIDSVTDRLHPQQASRQAWVALLHEDPQEAAALEVTASCLLRSLVECRVRSLVFGETTGSRDARASVFSCSTSLNSLSAACCSNSLNEVRERREGVGGLPLHASSRVSPPVWGQIDADDRHTPLHALPTHCRIQSPRVSWLASPTARGQPAAHGAASARVLALALALALLVLK